MDEFDNASKLNEGTTVTITDRPHSGFLALARRTANELATAAGLDEQRRSAVNVVTVELANNILQHASSG
jgi:hypothetical protein